MPQLYPAPWFTIFIITWVITLAMLKLMAQFQNLMLPIKHTLLHMSPNWTWPWQ